MSFLAECPFCACRMRVPDRAAGISYQCKKCQNFITLAPVGPDTTRPAQARPTGHQAPAAGGNTPNQQRPSQPAPAFARAPLAVPEPPPTDGRSSALLVLVLASIGVFLTFYVSLPLGSLVLSGVGLLTAVLPAVAEGGTQAQRGVVTGGSLLNGAALVLAATWLACYGTGARPHATAASVDPRALQLSFPFNREKKWRLEQVRPGAWVDASQGAVLHGDLCVCVASTTIGPVQLINNGAQGASRQSYLQIRLQIVCLGSARKIDLESWGDSGPNKSRHRPAVQDDTGQALQPAVLPGNALVAGHASKPNLYPQLYADDILVFEAPPAGVQWLRLELPASAFGEKGQLRFTIPRGSIAW